MQDIARDCLRVEKLRVFGEYLCGVEPPMLAYSVETKKYYSVAPSDGYENDEDNGEHDQLHLSEVRQPTAHLCHVAELTSCCY